MKLRRGPPYDALRNILAASWPVRSLKVDPLEVFEEILPCFATVTLPFVRFNNSVSFRALRVLYQQRIKVSIVMFVCCTTQRDALDKSIGPVIIDVIKVSSIFTSDVKLRRGPP